MSVLPSIGVFGSDSSARTVIGIFRSAGFVVSGLWASTREKAKTLASDMTIPFYTCRLDELLLHSDVDIVCVFGMPYQYAEVAVKALSIGKHVFCAAPAGLSFHDADRMVSAAHYYPKLLSLMNHPLRFLKAFVKAKEMIAEGYCGNLLVCECRVHVGHITGKSYDWNCDAKMGGGILHRFGCHIIDILTFLTGQRAHMAHGMLQTFVKHAPSMPEFRNITSDDFASFQLKYPSGMSSCVTLNSHLPGGFFQEILIVGTSGFLRIANCDLFGGRSDAHLSAAGTCIMREARKLKSSGKLNEDFPEMYLYGLELSVEGIKSAFSSTENTDRRNADHNLISAAANFDDGCYLRATLDAIIDSHKKGIWTKINVPSKVKDENPFWTSAEKGMLPRQAMIN